MKFFTKNKANFFQDNLSTTKNANSSPDEQANIINEITIDFLKNINKDIEKIIAQHNIVNGKDINNISEQKVYLFLREATSANK